MIENPDSRAWSTTPSFLTPPFGYALFYMKGVAPKEVSIAMIYRGIVPFVVLQLMANHLRSKTWIERWVVN